jgi:hypothetical protein
MPSDGRIVATGFQRSTAKAEPSRFPNESGCRGIRPGFGGGT